MKWLITILLCFIIPPIGIPILGYLIWNRESDRKFKAELDRIFPRPQENDFATRQEYLIALAKSVDQLEHTWRSTQYSKYDGSPEVFEHDGMFIFDGVRRWTIAEYENDCRELNRKAIPELLEQWRDYKNSRDEYKRLMKQNLHVKATRIKEEIISDLNEGVDWKSLIQKYSRDGCEVRRENGVWTVSYESVLITLCGLEFAYKERPNHISFKI